MKIGILGYGNLGKGVECAIKQNPDCSLVAVFTRRDPSSVKLLTDGVPVVKVDDIFELSYNRVFAPGTVLGLTPEDEETGEGLILSLQLNGELLNQAVDIDLHKVKDEIIEFRHMPGGDEDKLIVVEATL